MSRRKNESGRPPWVGLGEDELDLPTTQPKGSTGALVPRGAFRGPGNNMMEAPSGSGGGYVMSVNDHLRAGLVAQGAEVETLRLNHQAKAHVDAYLEYNRVVGDADGGVMMGETEYHEFKQRAIEMRSKNRIYVSWRCGVTGVDCKSVGPSSKCFCGHMYKQHCTDNMQGKQAHAKDVHCKVAGCDCQLFDFIPGHGTWSIKCVCKHESTSHCPKTHRCREAKCKVNSSCDGFFSSYSCNCGRPWKEHSTVFETREEREAGGRPVDNLAGGGTGYEALGAITDFSSLVDGHDRVAHQHLPFTHAAGRLMQEGDSEGFSALMAAGDQPTQSELYNSSNHRFITGPPPPHPLDTASSSASSSTRPHLKSSEARRPSGKSALARLNHKMGQGGGRQGAGGPSNLPPGLPLPSNRDDREGGGMQGGTSASGSRRGQSRGQIRAQHPQQGNPWAMSELQMAMPQQNDMSQMSELDQLHMLYSKKGRR